MSSDFDINFGPWINYGKGDKKNKIGDKMEELVSMSWSPFNGCDYAQVFIFCMAYAVAKGFKPDTWPFEWDPRRPDPDKTQA